MTDKSLDDTLKERQARHGDFNDHARIAQSLKTLMRNEKSWGTLTDTQREALEMIQHKVARILAGDANYPDHWFDIEGYSRITRERLGGDRPKWEGPHVKTHADELAAKLKGAK